MIKENSIVIKKNGTLKDKYRVILILKDKGYAVIRPLQSKSNKTDTIDEKEDIKNLKEIQSKISRPLFKDEVDNLNKIANELGLRKYEGASTAWYGFIKHHTAEMNAHELKLYNTTERVLDACVWWKADTIINLTKGKILSALNKSLKLDKEYDEQYPGITFDGIEVVASAEKVFAYKGQIITASSKQEAIQKIISK